MPMPRKPRRQCLACGLVTPTPQHRYCNNRCQHEFQYRAFIEKWSRGEVTGLRRKGVVTGQIKRFLREKYGNRCCLCGWAECHPTTGVIPLTAHHVDGDWRNNREGNLQLLCPNCHSLTPNYCGHNNAKGREKQGRERNQRTVRRFQQAREILECERHSKEYLVNDVENSLTE